MKKIAGPVIALLILYCSSYLWHKGWPFSDQADIGNGVIFALSRDLRMNVPCCKHEPDSAYYDLMSEEKSLYRFYYPLVKIDRFFGNYYLYDDDIPDMGG